MKRQSVRNNTGFVPLGRAVLVEPYTVDKTVKSVLIEIPRSARERLTMAEQRAVVIAVGPEAWRDEKCPRAKAGDHVMISAYAGFVSEGPKDGKTYRVVNANDIFLRIAS